MNRQRLLYLPAALALGLISAAAGAQTLDGLRIPPVDSAEAARVRIWAAAEGTAKCRLTIEILNDSNRVVRHYLDFLAAPGYYNFYWDKLDDSGVRVAEGTYRARVEHCQGNDFETLTVRYSQAERQSELLPPDTARPLAVALRLDSPASVVRAELLDNRGKAVGWIVRDTTVGAGTHVFEYHPNSPPKTGNYVIRVRIGDAEYRREVSYLP